MGSRLVPFLLARGAQLTIVSRDEHKHYLLEQKFPQVKTAICDIRDYDMLRSYTKGHDYGIWAASLKHIDKCASNWQMAKEIIVDGAINSRKVSEEYLTAATFISTDKAKLPTTLYGKLKAAASEMFILGSETCHLTSVVYGNVWDSTGSVVPNIWHHIQQQKVMPLYSKDMTRFMIDADQAIQVIVQALQHNGCYVVPKLKSFRIHDLFELYKQQFGLEYRIEEPRPTEKIHEVLITNEESAQIQWQENEGVGFYILNPNCYPDEHSLPCGEYSSQHHLISKLELKKILEANKYFMQQGFNNSGVANDGKK